MSYNKNYQHIVFRTKRSEHTIPEAAKRSLFAYIYQMCKTEGWHLERINAYQNHVHILLDVPATSCVSNVVQKIKYQTSVAFQRNPDFPNFVGWGKGYASFSVSYYELEKVRNYIRNQEAHHHTTDFWEEYKVLLQENGIALDYFWNYNDE